MNPDKYEGNPYVCGECGEVVVHTMVDDDVQRIRYECRCKVSGPGTVFPDAWNIERSV